MHGTLREVGSSRFTASVYREVVGPGFDLLPEAVRRAHAVPLRARGEVDVCWSTRPLARLAARVFRLPPEGAGEPLELEVRAEGPALVWDRRFGRFHLRTLQDVDRGLLRETAGPAAFWFRLEADAEKLVYRTVRARVLGLPVPLALATIVTATIEPWDGGWRTRVAVDTPLLGRICEYTARMRLE